MLEWLKTVLGDAYTPEIDTAVSQEIGKGFVARTDFNTKTAKVTELETEVKQLREGIKTRDTQLSELKKSAGDNAELQKQIDTLTQQNKDQKATYTVTDNDETGLNFLIDKCEKDILADINQRVLPDGLFYVHVDMVAGQFLYDKKAAGGLDGLEGFDFSAPAKSITEGDVAITFAGASDGASSAEARFDALLAGLMRPPESTLAAFRRMRW